MSSRQSKLLPQLRGQHPRVYFTGAELDALRIRAHSSQATLWARALASVRAVRIAPPPPPAETRRAQNEVGLGIAEAAFAFRMEGDRKYLDAARRSATRSGGIRSTNRTSTWRPDTCFTAWRWATICSTPT
jgi:hypothetical protein